jgi:hypothetical protein
MLRPRTLPRLPRDEPTEREPSDRVGACCIPPLRGAPPRSEFGRTLGCDGRTPPLRPTDDPDVPGRVIVRGDTPVPLRPIDEPPRLIAEPLRLIAEPFRPIDEPPRPSADDPRPSPPRVPFRSAGELLAKRCPWLRPPRL